MRDRCFKEWFDNSAIDGNFPLGGRQFRRGDVILGGNDSILVKISKIGLTISNSALERISN